MKHTSRFALAAVAAAVLAMNAATAAELTGTLKKIQETGSITLGYRESSVPFSYLGADGKPVGYAFEVCRKVAESAQKELGLAKLDVKYQAVTSANRIPLIQNGTVDIDHQLFGSSARSGLLRELLRHPGFGRRLEEQRHQFDEGFERQDDCRDVRHDFRGAHEEV